VHRGNRKITSVPRLTKEELTASANEALAAAEQLPDKHDLARYFKVTVRTIDRWTATRLIPSIKFGPRCTRFQWGAVKRAVNRLIVEAVK
jgi:hypothetical protein